VARVTSHTPIQVTGIDHLIDRTYREGGAHQWVRETLLNALEAGATQVEFGIEPQGAANGVFRRYIADNGSGMTADQLRRFFLTFGGGGKPIGGLHQNFGVGSKTSLLPWNRYGVVVVSWVGGEGSMIWLSQDKHSGEYGLRNQRVGPDPDTGAFTVDDVYGPYKDAAHKIDWRKVRPAGGGKHGTIVVLLGNAPDQHTVEGDPRDQSAGEEGLRSIASYLNRRMWVLPEGCQVTVEELRTRDRARWATERTTDRAILGAHHFITYPPGSPEGGKLGATGTVALTDGTSVEWFLWEGDRPAVHSYAAVAGYVAAEYKNELYDVSAHHALYRLFSVAESAVRQRLWLIVHPPHLEEHGRRGVYPRTDRNALLYQDGPGGAGPLPWNAWAEEWSEKLPEPISEAIRLARSIGRPIDESWREKLRDRFSDRWRASGYAMPPARRRSSGASSRAAESTVDYSPREPDDDKVIELKDPRDPEVVPPARRSRLSGRIPSYRPVAGEDLRPGILASWMAHDPDYPEGVVLINMDHPVLQEQIAHWQALYTHHAEEVAQDVIAVYGEAAVAKVAHSEHLRGVLSTQAVEEHLRSDEALTMALLGLVTEEATLAARLGGRYGRKRGAV
jgi:hypothetical protein